MVAEIGYLGTLASDIQSSLLAYDQIPYRSLPANLSPFTAAGRTLLTSQITSPAAVAAGIHSPFTAFTQVFGAGATVAQALRPYPQYALIDTISGGGDRLGHSTYHSMEVKFSRRYSAGLTLQASYVLSKALTDSDNYSSTPTSMDAYNLRLEKSIAGFDQTHQVKLTYVYELPFGKGKPYLSSKGVASARAGRLARRRHPAVRERDAGLGGNDRELPHFQRRQPGHRADLRRLARAHQGKHVRPECGQLPPARVVLRPAAYHRVRQRDQVQSQAALLAGIQREPLAGPEHQPSRGTKAPGLQVGDVQPAQPDSVWSLEQRHDDSEPQLRPVARAGEYAAPHAGLAEALLVIP